jgi:hypothetical protein
VIEQEIEGKKEVKRQGKWIEREHEKEKGNTQREKNRKKESIRVRDMNGFRENKREKGRDLRKREVK